MTMQPSDTTPITHNDLASGTRGALTIAIVHYHLRPGGVTRVIEHAYQALTALGHQVVLIAGGNGATAWPNSCSKPIWVPELAYPRAAAPLASGQLLAKALLTAAKQRLGKTPDLWHIHNHALGKNPLLTAAIGPLATLGQALVLQLHDLAEDGRPADYLRLQRSLTAQAFLYPIGPRIHYAFINHCDRQRFLAAGLPAPQVHLLPNAVVAPPQAVLPPPTFDPVPPILVYPTRAIRRKNLGELLLWAACQQSSGVGDYVFAVSACPDNPLARPIYDQWVALAEQWGLPVDFDYCHKHGLAFGQLLGLASHAITTSVAEGFGLAYLEPYLLDLPLMGRNLPNITQDFVDQGIVLDGLYDRLEVPVDWIGTDSLRKALSCALQDYYSAYGQPLPAGALDKAYHSAATRDGRVDFGCLDEALQQRVIEHVLESPTAVTELQPNDLGCYHAGQYVEVNRAVVAERYNLAIYGQRLVELYRAVLAAEHGPVEALDPTRVLQQYLLPEHFKLLRT